MRWLDLSYCTGVNDPVLLALSSAHWPALRVLRLAGCNGVSSKGIIAVIDKFVLQRPALARLVISEDAAAAAAQKLSQIAEGCDVVVCPQLVGGEVPAAGTDADDSDVLCHQTGTDETVPSVLEESAATASEVTIMVLDDAQSPQSRGCCMVM